MSPAGAPEPSLRPPSPLRRFASQARLSLTFYLGLGAPAVRATYPECRVRAASGYSPEFVRTLLALRRGESDAGTAEEINFRCVVISPAGSDQRFFFKDFPRGHALHDIERTIRCSRLDRAWRAAHLLPRLGILTPRPVGTILATEGGEPGEYLATQWLPDALPYHLRLRAVEGLERRRRMLEEFARHLRRWHDCGIYLRDLVTNVLTRESPGGIEYWLTDLDQLHPYRRLTRKRLLHQIRQLARWTGPLSKEEAEIILRGYLGEVTGRGGLAIQEALLTTPPAETA
ncbi:MAG: lipopolysaccharide kinase InaA family protein [Armatimonadetes bacterium]|nr:lipopolysaccharide kinase InaA family protein [Armatimonadota bacterium]